MSVSPEFLGVWRDPERRSAGEQMEVDHRLLRETTSPAIRFYRWDQPAITIGYFIPEAAVAEANPGVEIVRRRTGGGIVEHDEDLTFALAIPRVAGEEGSRFHDMLGARAADRYRWIHERLASALNACGIAAAVAGSEGLEDDTAASRRCFSGPVLSDVIDPRDGRKIAGGAQRRSREGWLHQGSVRLDPPDNRIDADWTRAFCDELAGGPEWVTDLGAP